MDDIIEFIVEFILELLSIPYIKKKSHKDSYRILMTHEDCGNIEIQNNLWYNAINSKNLNL